MKSTQKYDQKYSEKNVAKKSTKMPLPQSEKISVKDTDNAAKSQTC